MLRSRLIALECVVTALLSDASEARLGEVRSLASRLSHHAGSEPHPLTARALNQIDHMLSDARRSLSDGADTEQGSLFGSPV